MARARRWALALMVLVWAWSGLGARPAAVAAEGAEAAEAAAPAEVARQQLQHAWTFYWAGLLSGGDVRSFDEGLARAERVARALDKVPASHPDRGELVSKLEEVRFTLVNQRRVAAETLRGTFPMTAFLRKSILLNSGALGNYELVDDPRDVAITKLVEDMRDGVLSKWGAMPQTDVTVVSTLPERALEDKVLFLLSTTPRINLRPIADAANTLPPPVVEAIRQGRAGEVGERAREIFGAGRFIVITIRQVGQVEDVWAMELGAQVFSGGAPQSFSILEVTFDRRHQQPVLVVVIVAFLLLGVGLSWWLTRERLTLGEALALGGLAFVTGMGVPNALMSLVGGFEPPGDELAKLSFWWPIFAGLFILLGAPIAFTSLAKRFGGAVPSLRKASELGPELGCAVGAGVAAYLARGPIVYDIKAGWVLALVMMGCCIGAARTVAQLRARQTPEPQHLVAVGLGLIGAGPTFFAGSIAGTAACAVVVAGASFRAGRARPGLEEEAGPIDEEDLAEELDDASLAALVARARRPPFRSFAPHERARGLLEPGAPRAPEARWLFLRGQRGSGKTATAEALLEEHGDRAVILRGACSPPSRTGEDASEDKPFEVFVRAFHGVGMLGLDQPEEDIFSSIEGRVIDAIPVVSMLMPSGEDEGGAVSDRGELYERVVRELIKQTRRGQRRVVLMLDDVQWLDGASEELLLHLIKVFGLGAEHSVSFLLCGRALSEDLAARAGARRMLEEVEVSVELDEAQRHALLTDAIGFDEGSARMLDGAVTDREGKSNLGWLLTLVEAVARSGQVRLEEGVYHVTVRDGEELPIPDNFRKMVGQAHDELGRAERELLRVAACLGYSFRLEVLSRVVGRARLEVIASLEEVAERTGLIKDDLTADDVFKFVSTQRYLALREHLQIRDAKPQDHLPQLLRDLHLKIARELEGLWEEHRAEVVDVAAHYWAAGRRDLDAALRFCRRAARAARDVFAFESAGLQLERASACARLLSQIERDDQARRRAARAHAELELELRMLPFDEAHILGRRDLRERQADEAEAMFARDVSDGRVDVPLRLLIAMTRACYDARRFGAAQEMAEALVDLGDPERRSQGEDRRLSAEDMLIRDIAWVEGLHFVGLSLDPRGQAPERLRWLGRARDAAQELDERDEDRRALQARVYNSLAEQLSQPATYDFEEAREWFDRSIRIKQDLQPEDKPGLARAWGGLGRLHLFRARDDDADREELLEKARGYFEEDVRLCQDYGDVSGECQMHSHLGECALLLNRYNEALESYRRSLELSQDPVGSGFALMGLLKAAHGRGDEELATEYAGQVCEMALEHELPPFLHGGLLGVLELGSVRADQLEELARARQALGADPAGGQEE